ncbi:MAG: hypothetical protein QOK87_04935 [Nitrososphaeraceae archaeon]|nr:hypothetical protein [Nitrososphaeraceae archaeon]
MESTSPLRNQIRLVPLSVSTTYQILIKFNVIYKPVKYYSNWIMGRRKSTSRPHKSRRTVEGRCPKCTTIVRFNVSGSVGNEIYECIGCRSKFPIDEL